MLYLNNVLVRLQKLHHLRMAWFYIPLKTKHFIMKKNLLIVLLLSLVTYADAQNNPRPTRSRFWNSKLSTFSIKLGDILVYDVDNNGDKYQFIVTVKKFDDVINFNFKMPEKGTSANVNIQ